MKTSLSIRSLPRPAPRPRFRRWMASVACVLWVATSAGLALAAEIEDVRFPDSIETGDTRLGLHGLGLLRYRVLFRGYVGGLYLPRATPGKRVLDDVPKALELSYFWAIEGRLFGEAATEILKRQHGAARVAEYQSELDALHALYRDVEVGDRYRLTYVPGRGTELALNGEVLGIVPGARFARDYFGIWLGEDPLNEPFREALIRGR